MHALLLSLHAPRSRRWLGASMAAIALALAGCASGPTTSFVAAWTASQQARIEATVWPGRPRVLEQSIEGQTLRQVVRLSTAGESVRVKLSNRFGTVPVAFDAVRVALATAASSIDTTTDRAVTHNGQSRFTLPAGAEVWSDTVVLAVPTHALLAVSLSVTAPTPFTTQHNMALQTTFLAPGALASAATLAYPDFLMSYYWLAEVDVVSTSTPFVVVAFGDSLTDGFGSTPDQARRYPDLLDNRLKAAGEHAAVVNAGISGNRWLNDAIGPSGESRFVRDVLEVSGATHALILLGINDIGISEMHPAQKVSAEQVIAAMNTALAKAKARGVKAIMGTLTPFKGAVYFSEAAEAKRQAINTWIRASTQLDGVVDFDKALRDPAHPMAMFPAYDSGDHLHPNDDGYAAMANAVDLALLR